MIEIITKKVDMPPLKERRFQYRAKDLNGRKWNVFDNGRLIYTGGFENAALICHNLNKKYYLNLQL